jgi:crotonobetainyl-CoA:carnitine CoA-transferase CaiB-like acyl-CoA transferase
MTVWCVVSLSGTSHASIVPYQAFPTSDGHIVVAAMNDNQFVRLCNVLDTPDLAADARFGTNPNRVAHRDELIAILTERFKERTTSEWVTDAFEGSGLAFGPINSIAQVFDDPQVQHRNMVCDLRPSPCVTTRLVDVAL